MLRKRERIVNGSENQAISAVSQRTKIQKRDARKQGLHRFKMVKITLICVTPLSRTKTNTQNYWEADFINF